MVLKKSLMGIILVLLILPLASAVSLGTYKQNECVNLIQTCSNCTYANITSIMYPNSSIALSNVQMTKIGTYFYYNFCNTSFNGNYIVTGDGNPDGTFDVWNYDFTITSTGKEFTGMMVSIYIFFLLACLVVIVFSVRLTNNNSMQKDELSGSKLYEVKKRSEVKFYLNLLKKKMWIVGVFGIYLSILLFLSLLSQLTYSLGISELTDILGIIVQVLGWGLIPFIVFWIVYLIIFLWKSTEDILRYQLGGIGGRNG